MVIKDKKSKSSNSWPVEEKLTIRWLIDHMPFKIWLTLGAFVIGSFTLGMAIGTKPKVKDIIKNFSIRTKENKQLQIENKKLKNQLDKATHSVEKIETKIADGTGKTFEIEKLNSENKKLKVKLEIANKSIINIKSEHIENSDKSEETIKTISLANTNLNSKIKNLEKKIQDLKENTKPIKEQNNKTHKRTITSSQIIAALPHMSMTSVKDFLIKMIPKVSGGVSCEDLLTMIGRTATRGRDDVVRNVAEYIIPPFQEKCIEGLSKLMYSTDASSAISALLEGKSEQQNEKSKSLFQEIWKSHPD